MARPLGGDSGLKKETLMFQSLQQGNVPPPCRSNGTYTPGPGGHCPKQEEMNFAAHVPTTAQASASEEAYSQDKIQNQLHLSILSCSIPPKSHPSRKMLSGVKFIPRDELNPESHAAEDSKLRSSRKERKKSRSRKGKDRTRSKRVHYDSSDDEGIDKLKKRSNNKKWYSSDASSPSLSESESDEVREKLKEKVKRRRKHKSDEDFLSSDGGSPSGKEDQRGGRKHKRSSHSRKQSGIKALDEKDSSDDDRDSILHDVARKEMGLEWMLKPANQAERIPKHADDTPEDLQVEEVKKQNPRELNPYFKDDGSGYPEDASQTNQIRSSSVVGDGGASWRLKALKRAKEQAAREGRNLDEGTEKAHGDSREYFRGASRRHSHMREPKVHDSLSWGKRRAPKMSAEDTRLISEAVSNLNKFADDGDFLHEFNHRQKNDANGSSSTSRTNDERNEDQDSVLVSSKSNHSSERCSASKQVLTANQLAAKVLQLRMKGKHEEAEKLLKESEPTTVEQDSRAKTTGQDTIISYGGSIPSRQKKMEDNADVHLAAKIVQNKQFSMSGRADDEYDFDDAPSKKQRQKKGSELQHKTEKNITPMRFSTQQERCHFFFENPTRPRHLVVSIANFTYLMLPQWQPVVQGHCCILTLQSLNVLRLLDEFVELMSLTLDPPQLLPAPNPPPHHPPLPSPPSSPSLNPMPAEPVHAAAIPSSVLSSVPGVPSAEPSTTSALIAPPKLPAL
ncbi:hypothetical protein MRB53_026936 [Persea americana]|uniref:Uncharacterized protein n=1 Tax=Persea americana TaxID=3435 RepID=A0ACC2LJG5_PERAE|nr:hypothetical protein MRB53_026936 [Persea americana]